MLPFSLSGRDLTEGLDILQVAKTKNSRIHFEYVRKNKTKFVKVQGFCAFLDVDNLDKSKDKPLYQAKSSWVCA